MNQYLEIASEIKNALNNNKPIVALESTIISHGMPYPQNTNTALKAEAIIRENGAIPATIAIINGKLKVGLSHKEIDFLGKQGTNIMKTAKRDIPFIISQKLNGATTVSATVLIAKLAGIKILATGGIGGVHRGASITFDISSDLEVLSQTKIGVVCAGIKSILDLEKTLEFLETKGIPIIGYKTNYLPAFYTTKSPYKVPYRLDSVQEIADFIKCTWNIDLNVGMVIANPIPSEYEIKEKIINKAIAEAIIDLERKNISGNKITPFLLRRVMELTNGKSLEANIQLVYNNCKLAAKIARIL